MAGFAVISRAAEEKNYVLKTANGLIMPYLHNEYTFGDIKVKNIIVTKGFEKIKAGIAYKTGLRSCGYVLSKDYGYNYNPLFYQSCLLRALDFMSVYFGCDLRLSEVVIADAATYEAQNCFKLLLPVARRIVLVTDDKESLQDDTDYAINHFGTSAAVIEDPVKAAEHADIIILSSDKPHHRYLAQADKPTLFIRYMQYPKTRMWFNDVSIDYKDIRDIEPVYAQGCIDIGKKHAVWKSAEDYGFRIGCIKNILGNVVEK